MRKASKYELAKIPLRPRYVFIFETVDGLHTVKTYQGMVNAVESGKQLYSICMVDYILERVYRIPQTSLPKVIEMWRDNYLDPNWDIGYREEE